MRKVVFAVIAVIVVGLGITLLVQAGLHLQGFNRGTSRIEWFRYCIFGGTTLLSIGLLFVFFLLRETKKSRRLQAGETANTYIESSIGVENVRSNGFIKPQKTKVYQLRKHKSSEVGRKREGLSDRNISKWFPPEYGREEVKTYKQYLRTPHWKYTAAEARKRANYKCEMCGTMSARKKLHVHHLTYNNLWHESAWELMALCESCHKKQHPGWN